MGEGKAELLGCGYGTLGSGQSLQESEKGADYILLTGRSKVTFQLSFAFLGPMATTSFNSTCLVDNCLSISVFCLALLSPMSPSRLSWSDRRLGGERPCSFLALTRKTTKASD